MEDRQIYKRLIIPALWKPKLTMGCERVPWLIVGMLSAIAAYVSQTWLTRGLSIAFGFTLISIIAYINKGEPHFFAIWWRYLKYQNYYPNVARLPSRPYKPSSK
jgi:type IV secretory pathway TrbD component